MSNSNTCVPSLIHQKWLFEWKFGNKAPTPNDNISEQKNILLNLPTPHAH